MSRLLIAILLIGSVLGLVYLWIDDRSSLAVITDDSPAPPVQQERTETVEHIASLLKTDALLEQAPAEFFETLPASLSDVPKPVDLGVDENGDLVIDRRIRDLFEFYLLFPKFGINLRLKIILWRGSSDG